MYDTLGWYGRCVDDLVLPADVFDLQDDKDGEHAFKGIEGAHFAICKTSVWSMAGPGTQDTLTRAADLLRSHGAEMHELELPSKFNDIPEWYRIGLHTEGRTSFLPEYRVGKDQIGQALIEHVESSDNFTRKTQLMASDNLAAMRPVFDFIASQYSLHVPVLNVPGFKGDHDMPIGLSLVAPRYRDRYLLEVGKAVGKIFEAEGGWETKTELEKKVATV
ncbi:hypothetical protein FOMG_17612 [Fusarium oxysporum f. sp. melonis 26406]|uniref:Amidase domain-containing protein n=1 Tax=Fusarium oxysporum f. sp. melonis 26406 TaxID=1089452 RepID=W9ZBW9_FUSOX|nr:hypothetical protein FOMG_17612 [Fusarium oxysporum f. sp. melonis 26406]